MDFDPSTSEFQRDPYPTYALLRAEAPILWHAPTQTWYVSRYADVSALLRERRLGRTMQPLRPPEPVLEKLKPFQRLDQHSLFDKEPPDHTRLRSLVASVFTPRRVESLRPRIEQTANELLDQALPLRAFDLLEEYAVPLPVAVIADLLGVPPADRHRLRPWSAAIVAMYELDHTAEQEGRAIQAASEFWDYLKWLASERRSDPQNDLISALAAATDAESGASLSQPELIATCILLLNAGHEATVNGFGNGMLALFHHPDQMAQLRAVPTPERMSRAVEEMLRYDTPLQLFRRWVLEDLDYLGFHFEQGQRLALFFGSANRDSLRFERPDDFDVSRRDNPHLSFGAGIHFCLGAPLARLELNTALGTLLRRAPDLEIAQPPQWRESYVIRGLKALPVRQTARFD